MRKTRVFLITEIHSTMDGNQFHQKENFVQTIFGGEYELKNCLPKANLK